nr:hypothetical protein CFP56_68319 [Quercus suber]
MLDVGLLRSDQTTLGRVEWDGVASRLALFLRAETCIDRNFAIFSLSRPYISASLRAEVRSGLLALY